MTKATALTIGAVARTAGVPLDRMRRALARLAATCRTPHPPDECPLLTALDPVN